MGVSVGGPVTTTTVQYRDTEAEVQVRVLPRRVIKWLQSLKLSQSIGRFPKRELGNGFAVVEILARHGFREKEENIRVASFENDLSLDRKLVNWDRIKKLLAKRDMTIPDKLVNATIHTKSGAAEYLLILLHSMLTGTNMESKLPEDYKFDDSEYQASLPPHARATTTKAISSNWRDTEYKTEPDVLQQTQNISSMIEGQKKRSTIDRELNPGRYDRAPVDSTGHRQPVPPPTAPPTRKDSAGRKLNMSQKIVTQRIQGSPKLQSTVPLSPIRTSTPPNIAGLTPLKVTKRLEDPAT